MQGNTYTSQPISAAEIPLEDVTRVDIEFDQVDDSGASFEGSTGSWSSRASSGCA